MVGRVLRHYVKEERRIPVLEVLVRFLNDEITKTELTAELVQAAGRRACQSALMTLRPQIHYVLHADPLAAEPHDYADPFHVNQEARHCLNADDLLKLDDGRAASAADLWAADLSAGKVLYLRSGKLAPSAEEWTDWRARQWHERGDPLPLSGESPRAAPVGLCAI